MLWCAQLCGMLNSVSEVREVVKSLPTLLDFEQLVNRLAARQYSYNCEAARRSISDLVDLVVHSARRIEQVLETIIDRVVAKVPLSYCIHYSYSYRYVQYTRLILCKNSLLGNRISIKLLLVFASELKEMLFLL